MSTATRSSFVTKYLLKSLLPSLALFASLVVTTVPVWADAVIATIPVGTAPNAVAVNSATNKVYVANGSSNTVTVIDGVTNSATTVAVGIAPNAVAVNSTTNQIYVANGSSNTVTVIDGATNSTTTVAVGIAPSAIAVNSDTNQIYVTNKGSANVTVIDGASNSTTTVTVGSAPRAIAVNPVTNRIYVVMGGGVTVIDGITNSTTGVGVGFGFDAVAVAVNATTNKIYVTTHSSSTLWVIDGITNAVSRVASSNHPTDFWPVAVNPITNRIYVPSINASWVMVIDGTTNTNIRAVTRFISAGGLGPVVVNPVSNKIYVANIDGSAIIVMDGATNSVSKVGAGLRPRDIAINPVTNKIYVANYGDGLTNSTVTVIDGASPISTTSLISSNNPSIFGNSVTFTAAVSGVSPTGTVAFKEGFSGEVTGCAAQALVAGTATCTTSTLTNTSHGITAVYSGDSNNVASSSAWLFQYVLTPTTTSLASSSNPSNFGSSVTFTATVTGSSYGTVTFRDGGVDIANCVALPRISGDVTCTTNALTAGTHTIGAFFSGIGFSAPSSNELYQLVKPPTTTSIISSSNPSKNRSSVTFTATVTAGSPTGTVAFQDGGATIVGCAAQALVAGTAACSTSTLDLGNHSITAAYSGDASHTASTSPVLIQSVLKSLPKK